MLHANSNYRLNRAMVVKLVKVYHPHSISA